MGAKPTDYRNSLDKLISYFSPRAGFTRSRFRQALMLSSRHYEAASVGRRTQTWTRASGDANAVIAGALTNVRAHARDLVRNNPWASNGLDKASNRLVGWGIKAGANTKKTQLRKRASDAWEAWANSTDCDFDGRLTFAGMQKMAVRSMLEGGEMLVRRRRQKSNGSTIPLKLQLLEGDFLDITRDGFNTTTQNKLVQGVEYDDAGNRVAYWLYEQHPGATTFLSKVAFHSVRVPAEDIIHLFEVKRIGQARGMSAFTPIIVRLKDFDEYEDATLMRQKIAACFAGYVVDIDGTSAPIGNADDTKTPKEETIEPGTLSYLPPGKSVEFPNPPTVNDDGFAMRALRAIAAGLGISYEELTGDYRGVNFSSARMARLSVQERVDDLRWNTLIPVFCDRAWQWAMEQAFIAGLVPEVPRANWTPPPLPFLAPGEEGLAIQRNIRSGIMTLSEAVKERGWTLEDFIAEYKLDLETLDANGIILDSDARKVNQQGGFQQIKENPKGKQAA